MEVWVSVIRLNFKLGFMKTAVEELIHYIETVMDMYEDEGATHSDRGRFDAYQNVLVHAKSKMVSLEKQQIVDAWETGNTVKHFISGEDYYNTIFSNNKTQKL